MLPLNQARHETPLFSSLLRRAWSSDADFADLHRLLYPLVLRICRSELPNAELAEDACQATLILLHQKGRGLPSEVTLMAWLWRTGRFVSTRLRRSEARRVWHERRALLPVGQPMEPQHEVFDALNRLHGKDREIILLRYLRGLTIAEVADELGIGISAAQMRTIRALDKLKKRLQEAGYAGNLNDVDKVIQPGEVKVPSFAAASYRASQLARQSGFALRVEPFLKYGLPATAGLSLFSFFHFPFQSVAQRDFKPDVSVTQRLETNVFGRWSGVQQVTDPQGRTQEIPTNAVVKAGSMDRTLFIFMGKAGSPETHWYRFGKGDVALADDGTEFRTKWETDRLELSGEMNEPVRMTIQWAPNSLTISQEVGRPYHVVSKYLLRR